WPTGKLIALADLYVATASATIRWAIGCGVPVINFDFYDYDYPDYKQVPGVVVARRHDEFSAAVLRLAADEEFRQEVAKAQRAVSARWAMLDGRTGERFASLLQKLAAARPSAIV